MSSGQTPIGGTENVLGRPELYEPLAPFILWPNLDEIYSYYPEVQDMRHLPVTLFDKSPINHDELKDQGISRAARRLLVGSHDIQADLCFANLYAAHIAAGVAPEQRDEKLADLIQEWAESRRVTLTSFNANDMFYNYEDCVGRGPDYIRGLNQYAGPIQENLLAVIGDEKVQYNLLKTLVTVQAKKSLNEYDGEEFSEEMQALRWLNMFAHVPLAGKDSPVTEILRDGLSSGTYDRFIACDLLDYVNGCDSPMNTPEKLIPLKSLLSYTEYVMGVPTSEDERIRISDGLAMWPREHQQVISQHRTLFTKELEAIVNVVGTLSSGVIIEEGRDYKEDLFESFDSIYSMLERVFSRAKDMGHATVHPMRQLKRRHQPKTTEEEAQPEIETSAERQPLTLKFLDNHGLLHDADSEAFSKMLGAFLEHYRTDPNLRADVQKIMDYLSRVDTTNGMMKGFKKISSGNAIIAKNGARRPISILEFVPRLAPGLTLKTNVGSRTRTLVCLPEPEVMAILGIAHRDNLRQLVRSVKQ